MPEIIQTVVGFGVMGLLCWWLEKLWPEKPDQPAWRPDSALDLAYMGLRILLSALVVVATFFVGYKGVPQHRNTLVSLQPFWLQAVEFLVIGDFVAYWVHRYMHFQPFLWRIHAVHHSAPQIDWIVSARDHPLELVIQKLSSTIVLYLLGFSPGLFAAYVPLVATYSLLIHSNLTWTYGPFGYLFTSPAFHRWHHSSEPEAIDKNFSQNFAIFDYLFGTAYCPRHRVSQVYGLVGKQLAPNMWLQLLYPFQKPQTPAAPVEAKESPIEPISET
ncbi:MAG TPA: sterol desaturase family protein [Chthonomonadaceae bacterium]|nr:sterol desaturase family protein [Chthonomonadaceae bacterium]